MNEGASAEVKKAGGWMMVLGVLQVIVGVLAILAPIAAGAVVAWTIGIVLIVVGGAWLYGAFKQETFASGAVTFLAGLLYLLGGILVVLHPLAGLGFLGTLLAIYLFVRGLLQIQASFVVKPARGWGWLLFGGILAIVFGVFLMMGWPLTVMWAVGVFVGIELLFSGTTLLLFGGDLRAIAKQAGA